MHIAPPGEKAYAHFHGDYYSDAELFLNSKPDKLTNKLRISASSPNIEVYNSTLVLDIYIPENKNHFSDFRNICIYSFGADIKSEEFVPIYHLLIENKEGEGDINVKAWIISLCDINNEKGLVTLDISKDCTNDVKLSIKNGGGDIVLKLASTAENMLGANASLGKITDKHKAEARMSIVSGDISTCGGGILIE